MNLILDVLMKGKIRGSQMPTCQHHVVRTDIAELKFQIEKKIGRAKIESYLNLLSKFLSLKISKSDFDKLIIATVKRENISLLNALLRGIIKNVCLSRTHPLIKNGVEKKTKKKQLNGAIETGLSFQSVCKDFPKSPRKGRTQRRFKDGNVSKGNSQITEVVSSSGRQHWSTEDGEEVDQLIRCCRSQPIEAPFGVNLIDGLKEQHHIGTCYFAGELPDSASLKKKLEGGLGLMEEGLEVSVGFSNLLNAGLDVFLKRLIKPCLELAASRSSSRGDICSSSSGSSASSLVRLNPPMLGEDWPSKLEKIRLKTTNSITR